MNELLLKFYPSGLSHSEIHSWALMELETLHSLPPWHSNMISLDSCQGNELPPLQSPGAHSPTFASVSVVQSQRSQEPRSGRTLAESTPTLALSLWPVSG